MAMPSLSFHQKFKSKASWINFRVNFAEKVVEVYGPDQSLCYIPFNSIDTLHEQIHEHDKPVHLEDYVGLDN